jgi:hypothetical protein
MVPEQPSPVGHDGSADHVNATPLEVLMERGSMRGGLGQQDARLPPHDDRDLLDKVPLGDTYRLVLVDQRLQQSFKLRAILPRQHGMAGEDAVLGRVQLARTSASRFQPTVS